SGIFISLSPLLLQIPQTENAYQILQNCRTRLRELYRHHRFPLGDISKRLKLLQNGRDTLFDLVLSYEKHEYSAPYGNATISAKQQFSGVARYPLAVTICEFSEIDDVEIIFEGAENCFSTQDLQFLADRLQLILQQMLNHPQKPANELNLLTKNDENIIFSHFNHKKTHHQQSLPSVVQLFQQQAINNASKTAVEFQKLTLSYQQLDQLSNQLATHLINQGIKSNDIVAICLPRSMEMIIGLLAILKASAAYLPIPIDIPDERISNILQQSKAQALLTLSHFKPRLSLLNSNTIFINDYQLQQGHSVQHTNIKSDNLAYIIFTSGSSGQAKGVMIDHAALSSRIQWLQSLFKITPKDRMGQTIQYNFDPSIIEIFLSLTQGACLVLTPENSYTAESFAPFIINQKITSLALVPSSVRMLLQGLKPSQKTHIRVVCCGGERLEPSLAKQFLQQTEAQLFNVYGPTEATIIASAWECEKDFSVESLPIGKPADNTPIVIIDRQLKTLPVNEIGEIAIAGNTLAQGYVNQAELTTVAFPINSHDHTRLYKTGDLGYIAYDGLLYFSGRIDRQIKISGYRIELGEIESILQLNDNVNIAAVTTASTGQQTSIYAYVETTVKDTDTLIKELSLILLQKLPSYMQPRRIIPVTTIKTSLTGKIDYASLPSVNKLEESDKGVSPRNLLETQLQEIWSKTLSSKKISIHDNFFELGGDSLSAISLMVAIEQLTGIRQPLSFLLEYPSIAEQAGALHQKTSNNSLITLSNHSAAIPLFIAASGNGDFLRLSNLAKAMGSICNIHMLQPPEDTEKTLSIHAIAQCYADLIEPYTNAPYYISGFSIGGITALETAKILVERHKAPEGIILLDSIYPRWPLQSPWLFKSIEYSIKLFRLSNIKINNRRLEVMLNDAGIKSQLKSLSNHKIQAVDLSLELILTKDMWMFHPLIFSSWSKLFKSKLTRHSVTGLHGEMFHQPHLHELTKILKKLVTSKKN
ncbi:MAG: amino acid adenylation domain-containing protein, partial [Methylomarinum sp.]|nr:amino acid adenylation domain-containing protein [Methylomarinum sp.]